MGRHTDAIELWDLGQVDNRRMAKHVFIVNFDAPSYLVIHGVAQVNIPMGWMVGQPQHLSHEARPVDAQRSRKAISKRARMPIQAVLDSAELTSGQQFSGLDNTCESLVAVEYAVNSRSLYILMLNWTLRMHRLLEENYQARVPSCRLLGYELKIHDFLGYEMVFPNTLC